MAAQRVTRHAPTATIVAPSKEYLAAIAANDTAARPLLGWDGASNMYGPGPTNDGPAEATVLGVPLLPEGAGALPANKVLYVVAGDLVCFATPIMNFRIEYDGSNPLVITLVKYSGVA